jgi:hypothetical protein
MKYQTRNQHPICLAYQPPASSDSSIFLSKQISTSHQPSDRRTSYKYMCLVTKYPLVEISSVLDVFANIVQKFCLFRSLNLFVPTICKQYLISLWIFNSSFTVSKHRLVLVELWVSIVMVSVTQNNNKKVLMVAWVSYWLTQWVPTWCLIIAQLSVPKLFDRVGIIRICNILVAIDIISLMQAFAAGSDGHPVCLAY